MNCNHICPVILCGGSGTRLWPLSRSGFPKQFFALSGDDSEKSLFQQAVERLNAIGSSQIQVGKTVVVTNEENRFLVLEQLREMHKIQATLLLEPVVCNTDPAPTLAALYASVGLADPILVITLKENESTYIPRGQTHRLVNLGKGVLEIIEVQSRSYLGEDDIVHFEDIYGCS